MRRKSVAKKPGREKKRFHNLDINTRMTHGIIARALVGFDHLMERYEPPEARQALSICQSSPACRYFLSFLCVH